MWKQLLILGVWRLLLPNGLSQAADTTAEVTFRLHSPGLADDTAVYITGSASGLGDWQPGKVRMSSAGDHLWTYRLAVHDGQTIEYKYTLGSWDREGAEADGRPL